MQIHFSRLKKELLKNINNLMVEAVLKVPIKPQTFGTTYSNIHYVMKDPVIIDS
jgi:hypothetical protein